MNNVIDHYNKLIKQSLSLAFARQLPLHKGAFFTFTYDLSILLTSTAFVGINAKYGIPLLRYTVFFENCPLGYNPNGCRFYFLKEFCREVPLTRIR